jgi:hypothetical protein
MEEFAIPIPLEKMHEEYGYAIVPNRNGLIMRFLLLCLLPLTLIAGDPARLQFSRVGPTRIGLFLASADGSNEHALL